MQHRLRQSCLRHSLATASHTVFARTSYSCCCALVLLLACWAALPAAGLHISIHFGAITDGAVECFDTSTPNASPAANGSDNAIPDQSTAPDTADNQYSHGLYEDEVCKSVPFDFLVGAAMGSQSSPQALSTCPFSPYSTILNDIAFARAARESSRGIASALSQLMHGTADEPQWYDNAAEFLSLQAEMEAWVRANRTVGMSPPAYAAVVRGATDVLGLRTSLLDDPFVPDPRAEENASQQRNESAKSIRQLAREAYQHYANASLQALPRKLVSNTTFAQARAYHEKAVLGSIIVRSFNLDPETTRRGFEHNLAALLRTVQQMWDSVTRAGDEEAVKHAAAVSAPFLPLIQESDIVGPERIEREMLRHLDMSVPSPSPYSGARLQPLRRVLPSAVVLRTHRDCASCDVVDRAFEMLPAVFKLMCSRSPSVISCSPVTLFLRTTHTRSFQLLPSMDLYARLAYSRRAVLRAVRVKVNEAASGEESSSEADQEDNGVSRFYSLQVKYSRSRIGAGDEVLPRTAFRPQQIPLRIYADATSVEEALTAMIGELVDSGVIQLLFLDPREVAVIERENQRVRKMLAEQQREEEERRLQQQQLEASTRADNETANKSAMEASAPSVPAAPPPPNPEDHPNYRKVVNYRDLTAKMVATHMQALFGNVSHVRTSPGRYYGRDRHHSSTTTVASYGWWPSLLLQLLHAAWDLLVAAIEHPLYISLFLLLCLYQRWWNQSHSVSYW